MHLLSDKSSTSVQLAPRFLRGALAMSFLTMTACSGPQKGPVIDPGAYSGPPMTVDSSEAEHIVVTSSPSGGWRFTLDQVREAYQTQRAFVTMRRPNPALSNTQAVVEQRVATTVYRDNNIQVYARVVAFDDLDPATPYRLAVSAPANLTPLPVRQREKPRAQSEPARPAQPPAK